MAGIFGLFDFTKEGPGVDRDAPPKGPVGSFFSILGRRFWKLISINLMFLLFSLPFLVFAYFSSSYLLAVLFPRLNPNQLSESLLLANAGFDESLAEQIAGSTIFLFQIMFTACNIGLLYQLFGPVFAGITFVLRNYARDDHAFVWMDFCESFKNNFKISLLSAGIYWVADLLILFSLAFYSQSITQPVLRTILTTVLVILFFFLSVMNMYAYQMMVTFELRLRDIYRNAALFTMARLPLNLLMLAISILLLAGPPFLAFYFIPAIHLVFVVTLVWYLFFAFSFCFLLQNFCVHRVIDRFMLQPLREKEARESGSFETEEENEKEEEQDESGEEGLPEGETRAHSPA